MSKTSESPMSARGFECGCWGNVRMCECGSVPVMHLYTENYSLCLTRNFTKNNKRLGITLES